MRLELVFPGGVAVDAHLRGHTIRTDQPHAAGGGDTAPAPFDLFLASLATCTGYYAVAFCRRREIPTQGLALILETEKEPGGEHLASIRLDVTLPAGFPEKYRPAILRSMEQCAVKRHLAKPPEIAIEIAG